VVSWSWIVGARRLCSRSMHPVPSTDMVSTPAAAAIVIAALPSVSNADVGGKSRNVTEEWRHGQFLCDFSLSNYGPWERATPSLRIAPLQGTSKALMSGRCSGL